MCAAASAAKVAALYIVIMVIWYVGQVGSVPALWVKAMHKPNPLLNTISIIMAREHLTLFTDLLW